MTKPDVMIDLPKAVGSPKKIALVKTEQWQSWCWQCCKCEDETNGPEGWTIAAAASKEQVDKVAGEAGDKGDVNPTYALCGGNFCEHYLCEKCEILPRQRGMKISLSCESIPRPPIEYLGHLGGPKV